MTHTKNKAQQRGKIPWWRVTLAKAYHINLVLVYNRMDCCHNRIHGATVYAGNKKCGTIHWAKGKHVYTIACNGIKAKTVTIKLPTGNYLSLAEVQVFGGAKPIKSLDLISEKKPTKQSKTGWGGTSQRAVDGNVDGNCIRTTPTKSKSAKNNWWQVDLQGL